MSHNLVNGIMTEDDLKNAEIAKNENRFHSRLKIFSSTNGIRPRELSVFVGKQGQGKSTLCRTVAIECAISGHKVYTLLSEEDPAVYKSNIHETLSKMTNFKANNYLKNMSYESMMDWKDDVSTVSGLLSRIEKVINEELPEMVIFDNFSTSFLESTSISTQGSVIKSLRRMAKEYDVAIVCVFHTAKGTDQYKKVLDGEDVRGNATATNAGSYNYIISNYKSGGKVETIINLDKARYHRKAHKTFWKMTYDHDFEIFTDAVEVNYEDVKGLMEERNKKKVTFRRGF